MMPSRATTTPPIRPPMTVATKPNNLAISAISVLLKPISRKNGTFITPSTASPNL